MKSNPTSPIWRISLIALLAFPACFAMGWYAREWKFERDVQTTAEQIIKQVGGNIVPELGMITGGKDLVDRQRELENESPEEKERREAFFERLTRNGTLRETEEGVLVVSDHEKSDDVQSERNEKP